MHRFGSRGLGLTLGLAALMAVAGCSDSEVSKGAVSDKAKQSANVAAELASNENSGFKVIDRGNGYSAVRAGDAYSGFSYYLTGNFVPRDAGKVTYTDFSWPFDEKGSYKPDSMETKKILEYFAQDYPEAVVKEFYANTLFPELQSMSHFDKQDALKSEKVANAVNELYAAGLKQSKDVSIPVKFSNVTLSYNPANNRFEFPRHGLMPKGSKFQVNPNNVPMDYLYSNMALDFLPFQDIWSGDLTDAQKKLYPGYEEARKQGNLMSFSLDEAKSRELAGWLAKNSAEKLKFKYNGRIAKTTLRHMTKGEIFIVPDSLSVFTPEGELIATVKKPQGQEIDARTGGFIYQWLNTGFAKNAGYYAPEAEPAK